MTAEKTMAAMAERSADASGSVEGLVRKGIGGFYFVETPSGVVRAKGRGVLKLDGVPLTVGDLVDVIPPAPGEDDGVIERILPRKNRFDRPPVSNLDAIIAVVAVKDPEPNFFVLDKLLVMAETKGVTPAVCINKIDSASPGEAEAIRDMYAGIYDTFLVGGLTGEGMDDLWDYVCGRKTAFAGPSGVGKSTLINRLIPEAGMDTGGISRKTSRGRHTTRHVEMFPVNGGYLFDTPGFTSFDLAEMDERELAACFPDIERNAGTCRFEDCMHLDEPDCGVIRALRDGRISRSRYRSYRMGIDEIRKNRKY